MKTLIVFYSRTGMTRKAVGILAKEMEADTEEITEKRSREGIIGFLVSGMQAARRKCPQIDPAKKDYKNYDMVILGTPIWAGNMCSPLRTYLTNNNMENKKIGVIITYGGSSVEKTEEEIKKITPNAKLVGSIAIKKSEMNDAENKIKEWVKNLKP